MKAAKAKRIDVKASKGKLVQARGRERQAATLIEKARKKKAKKWFSLNKYVSKIKNPETRKKVEELLFSPEPEKRREAAIYLGKEKAREALPALEYGLFDLSPKVRRKAVNALSKIIGLKEVINIINKRYPGNRISRTPLEFFHEYRSQERLAELRKESLTSKERAIKEKARPDYYHRGFPVHVIDLPERLAGVFAQGEIFLQADTKLLPKKFRNVVAEHEFGEVFSHKLGVGLELIYAERKGLLKEYLKLKPGLGSELRELIEIYPKDFKKYRKYFN